MDFPGKSAGVGGHCGENTRLPVQETCVQSLGWEDTLQRERLHTPVFWPGEFHGSVHGVSKSQTRLSDFTFTFYFHALEKEMTTHSSVLVWRIPGTGERVGCHLWGRTESDTTEST